MRFKKMKITTHSKWTICHLEGRIDAFCDQFVTDNLKAELTEKKYLAVELSGADFLSLNMIRSLVSLKVQAVEAGGDLILLSPTSGVRRHLEIYANRTGLKTFRNLEEIDRQELMEPRAEFQHLGFVESSEAAEDASRLLVIPKV